jgi:hypothetical protein
MNFQGFRDIDWQLFLIRTYTWVSLVWSVVRSQTTKSVKHLIASFQPDLYCIYAGSSVPVRACDYYKDVAGAGKIEYFYNRDEKIISKTTEVTHIPRTLNIEGACIYHGDICLYDLTDFFDTTRYAGNHDVPSLTQWIAIWELENNIYLDRKTAFHVQVDFLGASKESFLLWDSVNTRWNELTSTAPRLHRQVFSNVARLSCSCPPTNTVCMPEGSCCQSNAATDISGAVVSDLSGNSLAPEVEEVDETFVGQDLSGNRFEQPVEAEPQVTG